ncbi:MAG: hypothetical protein R3D55_21715 [Chloroflexota bacterium]
MRRKPASCVIFPPRVGGQIRGKLAEAIEALATRHGDGRTPIGEARGLWRKRF